MLNSLAVRPVSILILEKQKKRQNLHSCYFAAPKILILRNVHGVMMMRIVCLSDTHTQHDQVSVPDGDVLLFSGDATGRGRPKELIAFNRWWSKLPHAHKLFTPGNHDVSLETDFVVASSYLPDVQIMIDKSAVIDGIKFYLSPWTPTFLCWGFMKNRGADIKLVWDKIPADTDVLVTHGPPQGVLDLTPAGEYAGCEELRKVVVRIMPKYHIFGHIHCGYGVQKIQSVFTTTETVLANVSICTEAYDPINAPFVFDL